MKNMTNINQLILDCTAKVLRINQMTPAQISFSITGHINAVECAGFKRGYDNTPKIKVAINDEIREVGEEDYRPLDCLSCNWIKLSNKDAEENLKKLLESLNALEKDLLSGEKQNA
jgi:hypothetical protein